MKCVKMCCYYFTFFAQFYQRNIGEAVNEEETLYSAVETVRGFTYLCDIVSTGGRCEAAVTV